MTDHSYLPWPVFRRSIVAAFQRSLTLRQRIDMDDQMTWMVSTMQRVGEMLALRFRDCRVKKNSAGDEILICEIPANTKQGGRTNIGRLASAQIYKRRLKDADNDLEALIFPVHHREALTELLKAAKLHVDPRTKFERNFKSFRATAISFSVLEGVDLLFIARNAGTSVAMIDQYYARRLGAEMALDKLTARRKRNSEEE